MFEVLIIVATFENINRILGEFVKQLREACKGRAHLTSQGTTWTFRLLDNQSSPWMHISDNDSPSP